MKIKVYIDSNDNQVYTEKEKNKEINKLLDWLVTDREWGYTNVICGAPHKKFYEWLKDFYAVSDVFEWTEEEKKKIIEMYKKETKEEIESVWILTEREIEV